MFKSASGWKPLAASFRKEFGMSHQDRKSKTGIVVNHKSLEQAVNELFTTKAFRQIKARKGSKWTARMLVTAALFWAWSGYAGLKERFVQAARLAGKILRWLPDPGQSYQGFLKQLRKAVPGVSWQFSAAGKQTVAHVGEKCEFRSCFKTISVKRIIWPRTSNRMPALRY
jgi:hypothetical protein